MPLIDKTKTVGKQPPVCPYCWETIERPGYMPEKGCAKYEYHFCPHCNALLAILPLSPTSGMDVDEVDSIIKR
jgi:hypothetical protein